MTEPKSHYTFDKRLEEKLISECQKGGKAQRKVEKKKNQLHFCCEMLHIYCVGLARFATSPVLVLGHCCGFLKDRSEGNPKCIFQKNKIIFKKQNLSVLLQTLKVNAQENQTQTGKMKSATILLWSDSEIRLCLRKSPWNKGNIMFLIPEREIF